MTRWVNAATTRSESAAHNDARIAAISARIGKRIGERESIEREQKVLL
jgi:hypothetical protein